MSLNIVPQLSVLRVYSRLLRVEMSLSQSCLTILLASKGTFSSLFCFKGTLKYCVFMIMARRLL